MITFFIRHPSESWDLAATAEQTDRDPSFRWDDVNFEGL